MNLSKLRNIAWVFFALVLTASTVFAQGWRDGNRASFNPHRNGLNEISGLTEKQQTQVAAMEEKHLEGMDELRDKRRSSTNAIEKSEIRTAMLKKVEAHRNSVKKVLTADQQKQYEALHASGDKGRNQQFGNGRQGQGQGHFAGRRNGSRQFARGNEGSRCNANMSFRGKGGNFQNGQGSGTRNHYGNRGNYSSGQNANYGRATRSGNFRRGHEHYNQQDSCAVHVSRNISDEGFEVIE